jgi:hypothetical protein
LQGVRLAERPGSNRGPKVGAEVAYAALSRQAAAVFAEREGVAMRILGYRPSVANVGATTVVVIGLGGIAFAAIPNSNG